MRTPESVLAIVPSWLHPLLHKRRETVKFLLVGSTCFAITLVLNYLLKLTILSKRPVTALTIATIISTVVSYVLNSEWSFRLRGGHGKYREATLFGMVNVIAIGINSVPNWISLYVLDLRVPEVTRTVQELSDFISGIVIGTMLAMFFRLWAFRKWVFPQTTAEDDRDLRATEVLINAEPAPAEDRQRTKLSSPL